VTPNAYQLGRSFQTRDYRQACDNSVFAIRERALEHNVHHYSLAQAMEYFPNSYDRKDFNIPDYRFDSVVSACLAACISPKTSKSFGSKLTGRAASHVYLQVNEKIREAVYVSCMLPIKSVGNNLDPEYGTGGN